MKNGFLCSIIFLYYSIGYSQWISFDLDFARGSDFRKQVTPFIKATSLNLGDHPIYKYEMNERIRIGLSYSQSMVSSGSKAVTDRLKGFPALDGMILVTSNLYLSGKISGFAAGSDLIQMISYGFDLFLTEEENNSWRLTTHFTRLDGPEDIRYRTIDLLIIKEFQFLPIYLGFGSNKYFTKILLDTDQDIPRKIEGQINYFVVAWGFTNGTITLTPRIKFNDSTVMMSIDLIGRFY